MTLKQVVAKLESIILSHKEINNFGYGMLSDIKPKADAYPYAFLTPNAHCRGQRTTTYSFSLIVMDLVNERSKMDVGMSYLLVQDRAIKIILDILSEIEYSMPEIDFIKSGNINVFVERFDDTTAGATYDLSIVIKDPYDYCNSPFNESTQYNNTIKVNSLMTFVNVMRNLTTEHKMLKSFYYGQLSDIKFNELQQIYYPYVFLLPTQHSYSPKVITYRFNLIICDVVKGKINFDTVPFDNYLDMQSNCIEYGKDLLAQLWLDDRFRNIDFIKEFEIVSFVERFEDDLSGATFTLQIQVPTLLNRCIAPIN